MDYETSHFRIDTTAGGRLGLRLRTALLRWGTACLLCMAAMVSARFALGAEQAKFEAVFADGGRIVGDSISDWHRADGIPKLDGHALFATPSPLRSLWQSSSSSAGSFRRSQSFVELVGGDRLPGRVVRHREATTDPWQAAPDHLVLEGAALLDSAGARQPVRILQSYVQRIVWDGTGSRPLEPGTLYSRQGERISFRDLRWGEEALRLLTDNGLVRVSLADVAELHFPLADFWETYLRSLAMLSPRMQHSLVRVKSRGGAVVTGSTRTFRAAARGAEHDSENWYQMLQPAWCLDPLWFRFRDIARWQFFRPDEVPLSLLSPSRAQRDAFLSRGWAWKRDASVQGGRLQRGGRRYGWGLGVHATSRLWFALPPFARGFKAAVALDVAARNGGCVRAALYQHQVNGRPLYRSELLIGSKHLAETGLVELRDDQPRDHLILEIDAAAHDHPAGADPLDIRDMANWLEPILLLQRDALQREVAQRLPTALPSWQSWQVDRQSEAAAETVLERDAGNDGHAGYRTLLQITGSPLTLHRIPPLNPAEPWLLLQVRRLSGTEKHGTIEVRIDEKSVASASTADWADGKPVLVALGDEHAENARLTIRFVPGDDGEQLRVAKLATIRRFTRTPWHELRPVSVAASRETKLHVLADGSVLASGENAGSESYTVMAQGDLAQAAALRLEVLPHTSLPGGGPGRGRLGRFILNRVHVATVPQQPKRVQGRYVRIELPGKQKILSLSEVQVYRGAVNLARLGRSRQSSTAGSADAKYAIDTRTGGDVSQGDRVSHTRLQDNPWWELDLRAERDVERIVVWNRTDGGFHERLKGFRVVVLDGNRNEVWSQQVEEPPRPQVELLQPRPEPVDLASVSADTAAGRYPASYLLTGPDASKYGWGIDSQQAGPHAVVIRFAQAVDLTGKRLVVRLDHFHQEQRRPPPPMVGRFRLSITDSSEPVEAESLAREVGPQHP